MKFWSTAVAALGLLAPLVAASPIEVAAGTTALALSTVEAPVETSAVERRQATQNRDYSLSCINTWIENDVYGQPAYLNARCRNLWGNYVNTRLWLGWCLSNNCGSLNARFNGNFQNSCRGPARLLPDGYFRVECARCGGTNSWSPATFDLDHVVGNVEGRLTCFGMWDS